MENTKKVIPTCPGCGKPMALQYEYYNYNGSKATVQVSGWDISKYPGIDDRCTNYRFMCDCGWRSPIKDTYQDAYSSVVNLAVISDTERDLRRFRSKFYAVRKALMKLQRGVSFHD